MRRAVTWGVLVMIASGPALAGPKVAVMPLDLADQTAESALTSDPYLVLSRPKISLEERKRLELATREMERQLHEKLQLEVVDVGPFAPEIGEAAPFYKCDACELAIARKAGADLVVTGNIQKITLMILNLNVMIRDAVSGHIAGTYTVPLRDNSDAGWLRGVAKVVEQHVAARGGEAR